MGGSNGGRGETGTRDGRGSCWEEIGQLIGIMGLVWREARNRAQRVTIIRVGLLYDTVCAFFFHMLR